MIVNLTFGEIPKDNQWNYETMQIIISHITQKWKNR